MQKMYTKKLVMVGLVNECNNLNFDGIEWNLLKVFGCFTMVSNEFILCVHLI